MRVALLTQNARTGDAIGRHVAEKAAYFLDRGAHVRVIVSDDRRIAPALRAISIRQTEIPRGIGWSELLHADLIVVDYPQYYSLLDLLPLLADGKRRIVFDYHGVTPPLGRLANQRERSLRGFESRGFAGFADAVIAHSQFTETELFEKMSNAIDRCHRLNYVIDTARFTPGEAAKSLRKWRGLGDGKVLLFVGRLAANKKVPVLVRALQYLLEYHAVIVGPCGDIYESERLLCREVAADACVTDRVHFLGEVDEATLLDCYRSADLFVMPSIHEGFCLPVVEAMACGLPVIAARAGALPETAGDAGLTFAVDDASDLARAVRRSESVSDRSSPTNKRIAVVTPAFGETAGGAERSMTLIARLLRDLGQSVDVLTTRIEGRIPDVSVKLFGADPVDEQRRAAAADRLDHGDETNESTYFANTLRSTAIVEAIKAANYDTVIVGPFGNALTRDVVRAARSRAIIVPCLHQEPSAKTVTVRQIFDAVGGVLYHSRDEEQLAEATYGFNHPNSHVLGTWIDTNLGGDAANGRRLADADRYVLICGRKVREKGLPETIDFARKFHARHSDGFRFVFIGDGDYPIPDEPWTIDLGRVNETEKRDLMAGAAALLQLSVNESLSLVVLEALSLGVPVIVSGASPVLARHVQMGQCGWTINGDADLMRALEILKTEPELAANRGQNGRDYICREFSDEQRVAAALSEVLTNQYRPMVDLMRERGLRRARESSRDNWRRGFDAILEQMYDQPTAMAAPVVDVMTPESTIVDVATWRIQLQHRHGLPLTPTGPGRSEVVTRVRAVDGEVIDEEWSTALPTVLAARQVANVDVMLPKLLQGTYALEVGIRTMHGDGEPTTEWHGVLTTWTITTSPPVHEPQQLPPPRFQRLLDSARSLQQLPDGYVDVTEGRFAGIKQKIKAKLLNNFRAAYVDVLARQQSRFNRQVTQSLAELAEQPVDAELRAELAATKAQCAKLADRLRRLEVSMRVPETVVNGGVQ